MQLTSWIAKYITKESFGTNVTVAELLLAKVVKLISRNVDGNLTVIADKSICIHALFTPESMSCMQVEDSQVEWTSMVIVLKNFRFDVAPPTTADGGPNVLLVVNECSVSTLEKGFKFKRTSLNWTSIPAVCEKVQQYWSSIPHSKVTCHNNTTFNCSLSISLTQLVNDLSKSPMVPRRVSACGVRCEQHVSPGSSALCTSLCRCAVSDTRPSSRRMSRGHVVITADQRFLLDTITEWTTGYHPPPSDGSGSTASSVACGSQPTNADELIMVAPESPALRLSCDIDHSPVALNGENVLENLAQEQTQSNSESEFYVTVDEGDANFQSQQDDIDMLRCDLSLDDIVQYDDHNYSNAAVHCDDVIEHLFAVSIQQQQHQLTSNQHSLPNAQGLFVIQPDKTFASPPQSSAHGAVPPPGTVFRSPFPFHSTQASQNAPAMPIDLGFSPVLPSTQHSHPVGSENQLSDSLEIPSAVVEYARNLFCGSHSSSASDMTEQRQQSRSVDQQSLPAKVQNSVATTVTNAKVTNVETSSGPSATASRQSDILAALSGTGSDVNVLRSSYVDSGPAAEVLAISSTSSTGSSTIPCSHRTDSNDVEMRDLATDAVPGCHTAAAAAAGADADDILCTTNNFLHITNIRSVQPDSESFMMWQGASQLPPAAGNAPVVTSASPMSSDLTSPSSRSIQNRDLLHNYTQVIKRTDNRQSVNGSESQSLVTFGSPIASVCDTDSVKASAKSRRGRTESSPGELLSNPEVLFRKVRLPRDRERGGKRKLYNQQMLMDIEESVEGLSASGLTAEKAAVDRDVDQTIQNMSLALECVDVTEDQEVLAAILQTASAHDQVKLADGGAGAVSEKRRGRRRSLKTDEATENSVTADLSPTTRERKSPTVEGKMQRGLARRGRGRGRGTKGSGSVDGENDVAGCTSDSLNLQSVVRSDESVPTSGQYAKRRGLRTRQASAPADAQEVEMLQDVGISSDIEKPLPAEKSSAEAETHSKNECSVRGHSSTKMFAVVTNCGIKLSPINVAGVGVNDGSDTEPCNMEDQIVLQPFNAHPVMTLPDIEPNPCPPSQTSAVVAGRNLGKLPVDLEEAALGKSASVAAPNVAQMQSVSAVSPKSRKRPNIFELLRPGSEETDGNLSNTGSSSTCQPNTIEAAVTAKTSPSTSVSRESVLKGSCVTLKPLMSFNTTSVAGGSVARSGVPSTGSLCESLPCAQRSSSRTSCSNTGSVFRLSADTPVLLPFVTERRPRVEYVRGVIDSPDAVPVASQNSDASLVGNVPRLALDETDVSNNGAESFSKSVHQPPCPTMSTHSTQELPPNQTLPEFPPSNGSSNHLTQKTSNSLRSSGPDRLTYPTPNTTTSVSQTSSVGSRSSLSDCASGVRHQKENQENPRSKPSQQSSNESTTSRLTLPTPKNSLPSHQPPAIGLTNLESTASCQLNYAKIQERLGLTRLTTLQQNRYSYQVPKDVEVYAFDCFKKL